MANRKYFPDTIKNPKIKHMESIFYRSREGILLCMWKDKKLYQRTRSKVRLK